jgi:predicted ATPase
MTQVPLIKSIKLTNFLSYGPSSEAIELGQLNVIIGPNGSGKSNLLEALALLRSAPDQFLKPIREGGGVSDWLWKGGKGNPTASLEVVIAYPAGPQNLRYCLSFTETQQRFELTDERIEREKPDSPKKQTPYFYYHFNNGRPTLNVNDVNRTLQREDIELDKSILAQRKDPEQYPEITYLGKMLPKISLYREWSFGRDTIFRRPQSSDSRNDFLAEDYENLGLILNRLQRDLALKRRLLKALVALYAGIVDYYIQIESGRVQVFLQEENGSIPATRLSDGTLRYLCLLAILCHPNPPPVICIEEPELGLHPDVLPTLAELLKEASERTQLFITTHSDVLVDAMSDRPEVVLIAEKGQHGTTLTRLDPQQLKPWLEKYRLGELWTRGEIGGTRW